MNEKSLVFVKPRNEEIYRAVFEALDLMLSGDNIDFEKRPIKEIFPVPEQIIREHYRELEKFNEALFRANIEVYKSGRIFLTCYSGQDIIGRIRSKLGHLDPLKSAPWTIRGRFSTDSLDDALKQKRYLNNVMHASSNPIEAERELNLWRAHLGR